MWLLTAMLLMHSQFTFALTNEPIPERTIEGTVISSSDNLPLPGVTIILKGTTKGTTTDVDGKYSIEVPDEGAVLVFSFIGYTSQEVAVLNQSEIDVSLSEDTQGLDEVVVVGYGTQKKINVTGAVSEVGGEVLTSRPVTNATSMLQGRMPGVRIVQNSGQPGDEGLSIRVRGQAHSVVRDLTPWY